VNLLDVVIVLAAIAYGFGGFRSGAVIGIFSLVGFFGGAAIGGQLAKPLGSRISDGRAHVPVAIVCVLLFAMAGQLLAVFVAGRLKERFVRGWARPCDQGIGAALGVLSVLLVAWMIAVPLASSPYPKLASEASQSRIVRGVNGAVPEGFRNIYGSLRNFLDQSGFPPVFGDLPSTTIEAVPAPPANLSAAAQAAVQRVHRSVFKIYGQAPECSRIIEGSGFVYAPHRMLTNAHVVAGTHSVQVQTPDGTLRAKVVVFDPNSDVAVLDVPKLSAPVLGFSSADAKTGDPSVVLGYPEDGPFTVGTARIRQRGTVSGRDIYNSRDVERSIYSIRGIVRSGNSGGPLITPAGRVLGIVFATAIASPDTGFVLSNEQIAADASRGRGASAAVGTKGCTSD
jgi:S1-C subfamily serine protease